MRPILPASLRDVLKIVVTHYQFTSVTVLTEKGRFQANSCSTLIFLLFFTELHVIYTCSSLDIVFTLPLAFLV